MYLKKMYEKKAALQAEMKGLLDVAGKEERSLNTEEREKFDSLHEEIEALDATISAMLSMRELDNEVVDQEEDEPETRSLEQRDYDAFEAYLRSGETRELSVTDGAATIPTSIANKIIENVVEMCPIFADAERYNVKGTLNIPYYDDKTQDITVAYATEGTAQGSTSGEFKSINLTGFLASALTDVSKSLINNSQFDIVNFVISRMARNIALFIENELINGTPSKVEGIKAGVTPTKLSAITLDDVIDLQESIPDAYQTNAYFIMNKATRTALRKMKDADGQYLINKDPQSRWGYTLFDKDVYTTEAIKDIASAASDDLLIVYGDMTGLAVKVSEDINIEVLREVKAAAHLVEIVGYLELDGKVQHAQKIAAIAKA